MIKIPTVLILGAGASIPYGYPSGEELSKLIHNELKDPTHPYGKELINQGFSKSDNWIFEMNFIIPASRQLMLF